MMNKMNLPIALLLISSVLTTLLNSCSVASGEHLEHGQDIQNIVYTTIAVINSDMGIEIDGERQNYSAAIINAMKDEFTLVSPAMAESGYESGAYGAVITFPSDVSAKILSFNSQQPEKVQLEFKLNPSLNEGDYIDTYLRIINLQVSINATLAFTYVSSIFLQFHDAQNQMGAVFLNNLDSLTAIDIIRLPAFSSTLDLDELPEIPLDPTPSDTAPHMESVSDFAGNVSSLYTISYEAASQQYLSMREGMFALCDDLPTQEEDWMIRLASWSDIIIAYGEALTEYIADKLQEWYETADEWHKDADEWYGELRDNFEDSFAYLEEMFDYVEFLLDNIEPVIENLQELYDVLELSREMLKQWKGELEDTTTDLEAWSNDLAHAMSQLETYHTDLVSVGGELQIWHTQLTQYVSSLCPDCIGNAPQPLSNIDIPTLPTDFTIPDLPDDFSIPELDEEFNIPDDFDIPSADDLLGEQPYGSIPDLPEMMELKAPPSFDISQFIDAQPEEPSYIHPPRPDDFWISIDFMHEQLSDFNVGEFLADDVHQQVDGFLDSYGMLLEMISEDLDMQFSLSLLELDEVRYGYIEYLAELKEETLRGEAEEQEKLRGDLDDYISIAESNNEDTHSLLSDFTAMMPESRTQAGLNHDLVDFTVAPFEFLPPEVRQALASIGLDDVPLSGNDQRNMIIVIIVIIILLATAAALIIYQRKRKQKEE